MCGAIPKMCLKLCGVPGAQRAVLGVYYPNDTTYSGTENGAELDTIKLCSSLVLAPEVSVCVSGMKAGELVISGMYGPAVIRLS